MLQDLLYAARQARRAPGFFLCAALLIAIGVAANTQIFTLVNAVLLRALPVREPGNLVQLFDIRPKLPPNPYYVYRFYQEFAAASKTVYGAVGQMELTTTLAHGAATERVHVAAVTDNYFSELGVPAAFGRMPGGSERHVVVLSFAYWSRAFDRDPGVIGQTIRLRNQPFTIAGVAPEQFTGTTIDSGPDVWMPFANEPDIQTRPNPDLSHYAIEMIARLRPGATMASADQEVTLFFDRYLKETKGEPDFMSPRHEFRSIVHGVSPLRDQSRVALILLFWGTGLLLLMVCANVGGLLLARATAREKETAVRLAVGASRLRIVRQSLADGLLLTMCGGIVGWLLAEVTMPWLIRMMPPARGFGLDPQEMRALTLDLQLDFRVALFSIAACGLAGVLCSLAPAWRSTRGDILAALKSTLSDRRNRHFQTALCSLQVALCTLLVFGAGLMTRSLDKLRSADAGFDRSQVAIFSVDAHVRGYNGEQAWKLRRELLERVKGLPGVEGAAIASRALMRGIGLASPVVIPGQRGDGIINSSVNSVSPEYFDVMRIRLLAGRLFTEGDLPQKGELTKAIVNQAFARKFFGGGNAVGKLFGTGHGVVKPSFEIVGVVGDTKYRSMREVPPPLYYTYNLGPTAYPDSFVLHVRTRGHPGEILKPVREALKSIDAQVPIYQAATLREEVERSLWQERLLVGLTSVFGIFALLLAAIGLYGIMAYFVVRRQREIGVRMALGARAGQVVWLVVKRVVPTLGVGLAAGAALSILAGSWVGSLLYGVRPLDGWSAGMAVLGIGAIGLAAAVAPAMRAVRVDPASALREE